MVLCTHFVGGVMHISCYAHIVQQMLCSSGIVYMLNIWYLCQFGIMRMSYMLCCIHAVLCMCIIQSWYHDMSIRCVVLYVHIFIELYIEFRCMYCVVVYTGCKHIYCVFSHTECRCMYVLCCTLGVGVCVVCQM